METATTQSTDSLTVTFTLNTEGHYTRRFDSLVAAIEATNLLNEVDLQPYPWAYALPVRLPRLPGVFPYGESEWGINVVDLDTMTTLGSI